MRFILVGLMALFLLGAKPTAPSAAVRCTYFGGLKEKVCPVSMVGLTTSHQHLYGKTLAISGYVKKVDGRFYVFTSKEFAENLSVADSILVVGRVALLQNKSNSWVTVIGVLHPVEATDYADDMFWPFAKLEIQSAR